MIFYPQAKLLYHGERVKKWLEGEKTYPILVEIDPNDYCNAKCPWCIFRGYDTGTNIDSKVLLKALKELRVKGLKAISWTGGGEPTLHPDFNFMVEECHKYGLKQGLFTNGIGSKRVDPKLFSWVRFSLTDKYYNGLNKDLVEEYRQHTTVGITVYIVPENEHLLLDFARKAKEMRFAYFQVRPALARDFVNQANIHLPVELKKLETNDFKVTLSGYKFNDFQKRPEYKECYGYFFCPTIDHRGDVRVCNYFLDDDKYKLGNIHEKSILEIIDNYPESIKVTENCQICCKNNEINKILYAVKNIEFPDFL